MPSTWTGLLVITFSTFGVDGPTGAGVALNGDAIVSRPSSTANTAIDRTSPAAMIGVEGQPFDGAARTSFCSCAVLSRAEAVGWSLVSKALPELAVVSEDTSGA